MRAADLRYPLLCLARELGVCVVQSATELERCRASVYWRAKLFHELRLVDVDGDAFVVARTRIRAPASRIGQWMARVLDLQLAVDVEIAGLAAPLSLAEVRDVIEQALAEDPETFEEFSGREIVWWRHAVASCGTASELLHTFEWRRLNRAGAHEADAVCSRARGRLLNLPPGDWCWFS